MKAFVVRPFGTKGGINFEDVHKELIAPALTCLDIQGGTTEPFMQAGNIRADMFQQLLVADLVIADISIHNANVFYELGVRHALEPGRTFLLRAKSTKAPNDRGPEDEVPFDLKTDRYLEYDSTKPAATCELLVRALRQTIVNDEKPDSPVFQMLPDLTAQDRARFLPVPQTFREDVELAFKSKQLGLLGLLAMEAKDFFWASEGLRLIGRTQFDLGAHRSAKEIWEELHRLNPSEPEANQRLGTIYQRLGELDASDQALQRVLSGNNISRADRAEAYALMGRNIKERWHSSWKASTGDRTVAATIQMAELLKAYEAYEQGFRENLDRLYAGLNALSLLTVALELARKLPDAWENRFDSEAEAKIELNRLELESQKLSGAVGISLDAVKQDLKRRGKQDRWVDISVADYLFLISNRPPKVALEYQSALAGAPDFYFSSARAQLEIFHELGIWPDKTQAALAAFQTNSQAPLTVLPARALLFTGHMIDPPGTNPPRFPDSVRDRARDLIREKVRQEIERTQGNVVAIASGASGGDLLFHEVCEELKLPHRLYLPLPADIFRNESVSPAGRFWEDQFDRLVKSYSSVPRLAKTIDLPRWLLDRQNYTSWQRANLWLIHEALALNAEHFTLMALWDGAETEGIGGTYHMLAVAKDYGASVVTIDTAALLKD
jgi:tetratricopeptide (TPR) repeat protein